MKRTLGTFIVCVVLLLGSTSLVWARKHKPVLDPPPTLGADCGNATIAAFSTDNAGKVTIGTTTSSTDCTLTFNTAKTNPPSCFAGDETSINPVQTITTPASGTFNGSVELFANQPWSAGDVVSYGCVQP